MGGNQVMTTDGQNVRLWDMRCFRQYQDVPLRYEVEAASISPNGKLMVAGGSDMSVHLYNIKNGQEIDCHKGHHGPVHSVRFAPDGLSYASGSEDGTIRVWSVDENGAALQQQQQQQATQQQQQQRVARPVLS
eukprot:TRINITY_DN2975_c0_g1_i1.p7 TRINITY_DN2975_c0_g1~~TRINITY_DN2975_c0_g1_i1.p7  ORF type:complete len:133 (+),score=21.14 TRINITY_DN2975_c0_g1_i1:71-469(+)